MKRGVSLIEVIIAMALCIPFMYILWTAMLGSRSGEKNTIAFASALKGATIFDKYIRQDLQSMNTAAEDNAITMSEDGRKITIITSMAINSNHTTDQSQANQSTTNSLSDDESHMFPAFAKTFEIVYELVFFRERNGKKFFTVKRNTKSLSGVLVSDVNVQIINADLDSRVRKWIIVDYTAYSPGLTAKKSGEYYSFSNTILENLPISNLSDGFANYSEETEVINSGEVTAWVESIDDRYIYIGAWSKNFLLNLPVISADINGTNFPVCFRDNPENHIERMGTAPYLTMAFDYHLAMKLTGGNSYRQRTYNLKLHVADPVTKIESNFFSVNFRPTSSEDFNIDEIDFVAASFSKTTSRQGLDLFLSSKSKAERPCYKVLYTSTNGKQKAIAKNISARYFHAFLENFPETGDMSSIQIENEFLRRLTAASK